MIHGFDPVPQLQLRRIVSGGQTGVDRAGLDIGQRYGFEIGGWCPQGRRAEDGTIPLEYPLQETRSSGWTERTVLNVADADATLVIVAGPVTPGSQRTVSEAASRSKPHRTVDLDRLGVGIAMPRRVQGLHGEPFSAEALDVYWWIRRGGFRVLNIAGTRESKSPGIGSRSRRFLSAVFAWKERA